jgi:peptidyl-prolyl cis-trans isomerase A (cyclophilin A)
MRFSIAPALASPLALFALLALPILFGPLASAKSQEEPATPASPASAPTSKTGPAFVELQTNQGPIVLELDREKAPKTVANFLAYVEKGFYDGTVFHRVMPTFMIQGGGFDTAKAQKKTDAPIENESDNGLSNVRGTIAMARTSAPDSATSQFFINVVDNPNLDGGPGRPGYAVFGKVVAGMKAVDAIRATPTGTEMARTLRGSAPMQNWPRSPMVVEKARTIDADAAKKAVAKELSGAAPAAPESPKTD